MLLHEGLGQRDQSGFVGYTQQSQRYRILFATALRSSKGHWRRYPVEKGPEEKAGRDTQPSALTAYPESWTLLSSHLVQTNLQIVRISRTDQEYSASPLT
jgi:hypothetical protein